MLLSTFNLLHIVCVYTKNKTLGVEFLLERRVDMQIYPNTYTSLGFIIYFITYSRPKTTSIFWSF